MDTMSVTEQTLVRKDTQGRHPLLEKATFQQLQRNEIVETRPQILHFGGFQIHKEHVHTLRILNISPSSLRIAIIAPSTPYFKVSYDKKGLLAPGMSEEITVTFTPHEWRYYYDTVKIFCGDRAENLVVPIHAYPSANDISLPRIVDFGKVAVGTTRTKVIPLSCKIPIQFEFEITMLEAHPDVTVAPLSGVIPPDGSTNVVVTFLPTRFRTVRAELQFNIAQFDFDPVTVTVCGSCLPDLARQEVLASAQGELEVVAAKELQDSIAERAAALQEKRGRGPIEVKPPVFKKEPGDRMMDGVKVPSSKMGTQAANFVLNQTKGKLPLKDLFSFIKEQREAAELRRLRAETEHAEGRKDKAELVEFGVDADEEDRQALQLRFEMQFREVDKYDKDKELKNTVATGEDKPSKEDVDLVLESRKVRQSRLLKQRMQRDYERHESVPSQDRVAVPLSFQPVLTPQWDENANDSFSVRLQVIDRFVRAGSKCLMRIRAEKRARMLHDAIRAANVTDRASCRAWVEAENKAARAGTKTGPGAPPGSSSSNKREATKRASNLGGEVGFESTASSFFKEMEEPMKQLAVVSISEDFVLPLQLPISVSGMSEEERQPVEVEPLGNFQVFKMAPINVRLDYKVLQYEPQPLPPPSAYMQLHSERGRLHGALEEHLVQGPRGEAHDGAEMPLLMPDSCLLPPAHDALSLLVPSTECRTYISPPEATECDPEYQLSQSPPPIAPLITDSLLPSNIMSLEVPWLESWRQVRQIADPFQHFDPMPGCFAEAGGTQGPRLGCDAGGERLSFLPVGGFSRDLPDDTSDDEADDFHLPPPSEEVYNEALEAMSGPVTVDLWRKEKAAEERLHTMCASNSRAVRDRLNDLNKELSYSNKLFLG